VLVLGVIAIAGAATFIGVDSKRIRMTADVVVLLGCGAGRGRRPQAGEADSRNVIVRDSFI
jgi:hypothetical protein